MPKDNTTKQILEIAIRRYFIRLHEPLFRAVLAQHPEDEKLQDVIFDVDNMVHIELVKRGKESLGYKFMALDRDVFFSVMKIYDDFHNR